MKNLCLSVCLITMLTTLGIAANENNDVVKNTKNEAAKIGTNAVNGAISGKKSDEIIQEAKKQAVETAKGKVNKKLDEVTK